MKDLFLVLQAFLEPPHEEHTAMTVPVNTTLTVHFFLHFAQARRTTDVLKYFCFFFCSWKRCAYLFCGPGSIEIFIESVFNIYI